MGADCNRLPEGPAALAVDGQPFGGVDSKDRQLQQLQHLVEQLLRWRDKGRKRERVDEIQVFLYAVRIIRPHAVASRGLGRRRQP